MPSDDASLDPSRWTGEPRRLHPASILLGLDVRQLVQVLVFPVVASPAGLRAVLVVLAVAGVLGLVVRVLAWQRFSYAFDGEVLRVEEGVVRRNHRSLDVHRIQQVEVDRSLIQRLAGLAAVRVETAGASSQVEAELRVVPEDEARDLAAALRRGRAEVPGDPDADTADVTSGARGRRVALEVPIGRVVLASVTGVRLLVFPAVLGGLFQFVDPDVESAFAFARRQLTEYGIREEVTEAPLLVGIVVTLVLLALSVVTALVVGVLRDFDFTVGREDGDLHVERGLLSTRHSVVPLDRIQLVQVHRNWLRRLLGYAAIRVHSAGGSTGEDRRVTIPLVAAREVDAVVAELYPDTAGVPALERHPSGARRRAILRWVRRALVPVIAVWLLPFAWLPPLRWPVLVLLPLAVGLGAIEYRQLGHGLGDHLVAARSGALTTATDLAPLDKVQGVSVRSSWFQRRLDLASLTAHIAGPGGDVEVLDAGAGTAGTLLEELTRRSARPPAARATARR